MYFCYSISSDEHFGEFPQAVMITETVHNLIKLSHVADHIKNYRPHIDFIVDFNNHDIEKQISNMAPFQKIVDQSHSILTLSLFGTVDPEFKIEEHADVFTRRWGAGISYFQFSRLTSEAVGVGKLRPNILAIPYHPNFLNSSNLFDM